MISAAKVVRHGTFRLIKHPVRHALMFILVALFVDSTGQKTFLITHAKDQLFCLHIAHPV